MKAIGFLLLALVPAAAGDPAPAPAPAPPRLVSATPVPRTLPPFFVENRGQAPEDLLWVGRSQDGMVGIRTTGALLRIPGTVDSLAVTYVGATAGKPVPEIPLPGRVSFFLGGVRTVRAAGVPTYGAVRHTGVWPGVDLAWTFGESGPVLEIRLAPGADPGRVRLAFPGRAPRIDPDGSLLVRWEDKHAPAASPYSGVRFPPPPGADFRIAAEGVVTLTVSAGAKATGTVVACGFAGLRERASCWIDDVCGTGVAPDGTVILVGRTTVLGTPDFGNPSTDIGMEGGRGVDVFVARVDPSGTVLRSLTFYGSGGETPRSMAVGPDGCVAVVGNSLSMELPTTPGALQPKPLRKMGSFVVKFAPAGDALVFATWLGGNEAKHWAEGTEAWGVAMDGAGAVFVTGLAKSYDFPFTGIPKGAGPPPAVVNDGNPRRGTAPGPFLAKLRPDGKSAEFVVPLDTRGGGMPMFVAIDASGGAWVAGLLPYFLVRVSPDGGELLRSDSFDNKADVNPRALVIDKAGRPLLAGEVRGKGFPVVHPAMGSSDGSDWDAFLCRFQPDAKGFVHSSYLGFGIENTELNTSIALDPAGRAVVAGSTWNSSAWNDTPMEKRHLLPTRWYFTIWGTDGALLRTADIDLQDHWGLRAFAAVGPDGSGYLGGALRLEPDAPMSPKPHYIRQEVYILPLDLSGKGLFPAPVEEVDPRFRMRPVKRRPGGAPSAADGVVAGAVGRGAGGMGTGAGTGDTGDGSTSGAAGDGAGGKSGDLVKGILVDRPLAGADRIRVEGRFDATAMEENGDFDPATDALQILLGDRNAPFIFRIPAGDARWKRSENGKLLWKSTVDSTVYGRVEIFPDRGTFFVQLYGFDFPGAQANPIGVVLEGRRPFAGGEETWKSEGEGVFRYPE